MNVLDHLIPYIDNGGRRSYVERRRKSKITGRIPERRTLKDRRINFDRRRTLRSESNCGLIAQDRLLLNCKSSRAQKK